jgi:hypothetical protein
MEGMTGKHGKERTTVKTACGCYENNEGGGEHEESGLARKVAVRSRFLLFVRRFTRRSRQIVIPMRDRGPEV